MKSLGNHLYNRNGNYYFRLNPPKEISEIILMTEIVIALGTKDTLKARLYCAQLDYQINNALSDTLTLIIHSSINKRYLISGQPASCM